jgi:threonylcarbamoyladenosine tRNA methylthiotransferase MtaB
MKYAVITFGCRVNQADSLAIEGAFRERGAVSTSPDDADVVVVNTCSVTATADQGARQTIRRVARTNPGAKIIVTGCYATRRPGELSELPNVVQVVVNRDKDDFGDLLGDRSGNGDGDGPCGHALEPGVAGRTAFTLRVQTGCEERCSYCIIPQTRGAGRSRPLSTIVQQIELAIASGYREVAITGVHLGSYGRDLDEGSSLTTLVRRLAEWDADVLFRISSLEPMDCSDAIVDLVAASSCFAPHFHLPLQHASDAMLVAMRRPYTLAYYRRLVDRIREEISHASIGTDIIVGFPGETDEDFALLEEYLRDAPITHLHVFPYSDRPGTAASELTDKVHGSIVRERAALVRAIGRELGQRFHSAQNGSVRPGLTIEDGSLVVTDNYLKVRIPHGLPRNERVTVALTTSGGALVGTVL